MSPRLPDGQLVSAVTLDAFGTLFDFEAVLPSACREIVDLEGLVGVEGGDGVDPETLARTWGAEFVRVYESHAAAPAGAFRSLRRLTEEGLVSAFRQLGLAGDPERATALWFERLAAVRTFPEVPGAVARLAKSGVRLAILSDTDDDLLAPALTAHRLPVRHVFTSESARAYKLDPAGRLFRAAIKELGVAPQEIVHVGDAAADVLGAQRAGMRSVWVNRARRSLPTGLPIHPDHEIGDLAGLPELLGIA